MNSNIKQKVKNTFIHLPSALFWNLKYSYPSKKLKVIGVTGTDGKTTTCNMIYKILLERGEKVGLISTISAKYNGKDIDTGFHVTSPNSKNLQMFLSLMLSEGVEIVILEVTSHALDQYRFLGVKFDLVVYTNITHEHLDYHGTYENYINTKLKLIDMLKDDGKIIANYDDDSFPFIVKKINRNESKLIKQKQLYIYGGIKEFDDKYKNFLRISKNSSTKYGLEFDIKVSEVNQGTKAVVTHTVKIPILGEYNIYNGTAALLATYFRFNVEPSIDQSIKSLNTFNALVGRMQIMNNSPLVIVDFAHTPNALKNALNTVQSITKGKLFVVFGCAGLRDKKKRTMMGAIAAEYADSIFIVPEDPRTESLKSINDEIITGIQLVKDKNFILEANLFRYDIPEVKSRVEGVNAAINRASSEDTVIICGKGHEQSLCFDVEEYPYSDQETVINYLNKYNEVISNSRVTNKG